MKKIYGLIILLILLLMPTPVHALREGISNYYIDATVLENGDLHVKELIVLNGTFNGFERIINFRNLNAPLFDGKLASFEGSDIYNGSDIILTSIKDILIDKNINFSYIYNQGDRFQEAILAIPGDYGVYTVTPTVDQNGKTFKIFNPSTRSNGTLINERGFYIEYVIKNMGIVYQDVAELGWNVFSDQLTEYVNHLEIHINIPNNKTLLRAWAHGPLNGTIDLVGKTKLIVKIDDLNAATAMDVRFMFDKEVIKNSTKIENIDGKDNILKVEKGRADKANNARNIEKIKYYGMTVLSILWMIGLIPLIIYVYNRFDKERSSTFKTKYFRDFPANYGPEIVGYLFNHSIGSEDLSASIVNLVTKKVIAFEEVEKKKYLFKLVGADLPMTKAETKLTTWLFGSIGDGSQVTMEQINKNAKGEYEAFLKNFGEWKNLALTEAKEMNFFEKLGLKKFNAFIYGLAGIGLAIINFNLMIHLELSTIIIIAGIFAAIYFLSVTKRTVNGNEDYVRWKGLKNFLNDFGKFSNRDLPNVVLWEKYLVYALVFGNADKLAKTMSIKFTEIYGNQASVGNHMFDIYYMNNIMNMNRSINSGLNNAVNTAVNTRTAAQSRSSSSGGFGGGFSSGGGSFGGGGGGGRF